MIERVFPIALAAAATLLCAATAPPNGGTISIEPAPGDAAARPADPKLVDAIGQVLGAHGFTMLGDPGHSAYLAEVTLDRAVVGTGSAKASDGRASVAPGMFGAAGGGVTVPLSAGHTVTVPLERFQLSVRIRKRATGEVVWRGAAVTIRALDGRNPVGVIASDLGGAILRFYPRELPGVISVP